MSEIRNSFGARWDAVAGVAYEITERTIRKHLSEEDAFQRKDEETFILCFAASNKAEAKSKTTAIVAEIRAMLAEEAPGVALNVDDTVAELDWASVEEDDASIVDAIAGALGRVRSEAMAAARIWRRDLLERASVLYNPIWQPQTRLISAYRSLLDEETGKHALRRFSTISSADELKTALCDLDCLIVGRAIESLHRLIQEGGKAHLLIPVNFNTIQERSHRENYLKLCIDIPDPYKQFVIFELHGAAAGTPTTRVIEIALALKAHAQGVVVEAPPSIARIQELGATGLVGISINAKSVAENLAESAGRLARFVSAARALSLKTFAHSADTLGSVEAAIKAQVDYIDGCAVAPPTSAPKNVHHWKPR